MDFLTIDIPKPDFNFEELIKRRAQECATLNLYEGVFVNGNNSSLERKQVIISEQVYSFKPIAHKILFIVELLNHTLRLKISVNYSIDNSLIQYPSKSNSYEVTRQHTNECFNSMLLFFYECLNEYGYNLDTNAFTEKDIETTNSKIDEIISKLSEVQAGEEVLYNFIAELKDDIASLKDDHLSGKKKWYQRATGIVAVYSATLVADSAFDPVKPLLHDLIYSAFPDLANKLLK